MNTILISIIYLVLSLVLNIIIAIFGIIPTVFITAFNIEYFGVIPGFFISLIGEALGALISFYIYQKGFKKISINILSKYPKIYKLLNTNTDTQVKTVILLRILPYMPSGIVTYAAAISTMSIKKFTIASTIGKIPALMIEVLIVSKILVIAQEQKYKTILLLLSFFGIIFLVIKEIRKK